jgi:glycosyltransferase involved in cell wall biosynthesis
MNFVIVCPTILENDAVGNATLALAKDLRALPNARVSLIARNSDRDDIGVTQVQSLGDLLLDKDFRAADVIFYAFAIYNELFDAMLVGNGRAAQIVRFHNVTPRAFVSPKDYSVVDRSLGQIQNFSSADEVWADSQENLEELVRHGIDVEKVRVMPLPVSPLAVARTADKSGNAPLRIVFVGRFVASKGLEDLISALAILRRVHGIDFRARLIGSTRHSPPAYLRELCRLIALHDLGDLVRMDGAVGPETLADAYREAHIFATASRHEGFCVPVIEGMAAGCIAVTYSNSNLRHIAGGLGRLARTDSPADLAERLAEVGRALVDPASDEADRLLPVDAGPMSIAAFEAACLEHVARFSPQTCAARVRVQLGRWQEPITLEPA